MTLSHCWGPNPVFKLLSSNYEALSKCIPEEQLPKTFCQALLLARHLKVDYLWIDSLCIIQDSVEDWLHESALMGGVYQNSFCNLSATFALDGSVGLWNELYYTNTDNPRDPLNRKHKIIGVRTEKMSSVISWFLKPSTETSSNDQIPSGSYEWIDPELWNREITDSAAGSRGWIVQERILSRRVLHFCKRSFFWECLEKQASSRYHDGLPDVFREETAYKLHSIAPWLDGNPEDEIPLVLKSFDYQSSSSQAKAFMTWKTIVEMYSGTKVTRGTDKLVAISGLVYQLAPCINAKYLAGLWLYHFRQQLAWMTDRPVAKADSYQAPSWSWASVNSKVQLSVCLDGVKDTHENSFLAVFGYAYELTNENAPYQGVKYAILKLGGSLIPAKWKRKEADKDLHIDFVPFDRCTLEARGVCFFNYPDVLGEVPSDVYMVPIFARQDNDGEIDVFGMILEPTQAVKNGKSRGEFRRCGAFVAEGSFSYDRDLVQAERRSIPREHYLELDETNLIYGHVFTVI